MPRRKQYKQANSFKLGITEKEEINQQGDNYVCEQLLNQLEADFLRTTMNSLTLKHEKNQPITLYIS